MRTIKLRLGLTVILIVMAGLLVNQYFKARSFAECWKSQKVVFPSGSSFEFKRGDILIRPNWKWWPGSISIPGGRIYGHVGVVVEGATGNNAEEALKKACIVEALFFDQKTKRFLFNTDDQLRKESAWVSFGSKFKGIRYRLRTSLSPQETDSICNFLCSQLDARYNILSLKSKQLHLSNENNIKISRRSWQCATLTWTAFYFIANKDIDGNGGILTFPSDIIGSDVFNSPDGRICF